MALSEPIEREVASLEDAGLQSDVRRVLEAGVATLGELGQLRLPQYEEQFAEQSIDHAALAARMAAVLLALNRFLYIAFQTFPRQARTEAADDADFDFEFDLVDDGSSSSDARVDDLVDSLSQSERKTSDPRSGLGDVVEALAGMLQSRVQKLAERLDAALRTDDGWSLLRELDDFQHMLDKGVQALLLGMLGVFSSAPREELLPEYRSQLESSIALRKAVVRLSRKVDRLNAAIATKSDGDLKPYLLALSDQMKRYVLTREYRDMRAEDKRAVVEFCRELNQLRGSGGTPQTLAVRRSVEGFSKFLQGLDIINMREVLQVHDRSVLEGALTQLQAGVDALGLGTLLRMLGSVEGRTPELDEALQRGEELDLARLDPAATASWRADLLQRVQVALSRL